MKSLAQLHKTRSAVFIAHGARSFMFHQRSANSSIFKPARTTIDASFSTSHLSPLIAQSLLLYAKTRQEEFCLVVVVGRTWKVPSACLTLSEDRKGDKTRWCLEGLRSGLNTLTPF